MVDYDDIDYDERYDDAMEDALASAADELIDEAMHEASADNVREYLCRYGDAVEERVHKLLDQARDLVSEGFYGPATIVAVTASEIIIRFLLLRPLVQGAFLDEIWAEILTDRVVRGRSADERNLLPRVLRGWGIDITRIPLTDGPMLWQTFRGVVLDKRNTFVHVGKPVDAEDANLAIGCSQALLEVAHQVGLRFGCGPSVTGKWHEVSVGSGFLSHSGTYDAKSPFE